MKKLVILVMLLCSCGSYQYVPSTYVDVQTSPKDITSMFTGFDTSIVRIKFEPFKARFYFTNNYGYWSMRPLWMDFNFYQGNFYNYYSSFYRPWNYWEYYMVPWNQGPFNNQGYNVVYNSSRRNQLKVKDALALGKLNRSRLVLNNKPVVSYKPVIRPKVNYNKPKPSFNSKPSFNNKPSFNSKPSYNSRPSYNSKPSNSSTLIVTRVSKKGN
jgi:hypothetical protein